mgnify:CR=1 FL=1
MARVVRVGRRSPGQRCAYCHGPLGHEPHAACEGCGATLHASCREELARCPSPGCPGPRQAVSRREPAGAPQPELRLSPEIEAALDAAHRSSLARRRQEGREAWTPRPRGPAGAWARVGPYARLSLSAIFSLVACLTMSGLLIAMAVQPLATWTALTSGPKASPWPWAALILVVLTTVLAVGAYLSAAWLLRIPGVWRELGQLLDHTRPVPMRLTIRTTGSGKHRQTWADLTGGPHPRLSLCLDGLLPPGWLTRRSGEEVLVYGLPPPGPYLLEFSDGRLALVHPDG